MLTIRRLASVLLLLIVAACAQQPAPEVVVIHEDAVVLDPAARGQLSEFRDDGTLVFVAAGGASLPTFEVGDVLISEPAGAAAPDGLLRRVTAIDASEPGQLTVTTEQATLLDVIEKGLLEETFELTEDDIESIDVLTDGLTYSMMDRAALEAAAVAAGLEPHQAGSFGYDFEVVIYDVDGDEDTKDDRMLAFGGITVKPTGNIELDVDCSYWCFGGIEVQFLAEVGLNETAKLGLKGTGPLGIELEKTIPLISFNMKPLVFGIGPVPVVITPKLKLELKFEGTLGATVSYEVVQTLSTTVGVSYDDGWDAHADFDSDFTLGPVGVDDPFSAQLVAKAKGVARAELLFYGVLGPTFEFAPYLKVDVKYPRDPIWTLHGGLQADLGVHIDVLGFDKNYETNVYDNSTEIARSGNHPPELTFQTASPSQVLVESGLMLRAQVTDPEEGSPCCTVTYRSSNTADGVGGTLGTGSGTSHELLAVFASTGTRTVTARAVDAKGAAAESSITVNVTNEPPLVYIYSPFAGQEFYRGQEVKLRASSFDASEPGFALDCSSQLVWTSSVVGDPFPITGCDGFTSFPSNGARTLTLTGTDSHGGTGELSVTVNVVNPPANLPPVVRVTSPPNLVHIGPDTELTLTGTATDPEGLAVTTYAWDVSTNYNPYTGVGDPPVPAVPDGNNRWSPSDSIDYSGGTCEVDDTLRLRLLATDAGGAVGSDFVVVHVSRFC